MVVKDLFKKSATEVAPRLVGMLLCRRLADGSVIKARITETECYYGEEDTACHAHKGRTARTDVMYLEGGRAYVYLCYGIHSLINIVSGEENSPEAVLIRGVGGANGPGKASKLLKIDTSLTGYDLTLGNEVWLENDGLTVEHEVAPRVGIDYASEKDRNRLWRFISKAKP